MRFSDADPEIHPHDLEQTQKVLVTGATGSTGKNA
jgi:FlaA1/EpsC-like NDP-sugar epimerase